MGVGKTTFVQGLAQGLGVAEHVTSPTFAIYSVYRGAACRLVHLDAYRLEKEGAGRVAAARGIPNKSVVPRRSSGLRKTGAWLPERRGT